MHGPVITLTLRLSVFASIADALITQFGGHHPPPQMQHSDRSMGDRARQNWRYFPGSGFTQQIRRTVQRVRGRRQRITPDVPFSFGGDSITSSDFVISPRITPQRVGIR